MELDPAVMGTSLVGCVGIDRLRFAIAFIVQTLGVYAFGYEVVDNGFGSVLRQTLIVFRRAMPIGMSTNFYPHRWMRLKKRKQLLKLEIRLLQDNRLVVVEENVAQHNSGAHL